MQNPNELMIIAEIGSVHDGSFGNACKLIEMAKECGANAVKFQLHDAENETIYNAPNPEYFKSENRYNYFQRTSFNYKQLVELKKLSKKLKLQFIVSPFSIQAAQLLNKINIDGFKIASGEVNNDPLLIEISKYKKRVYLSSGMSSFSEIDHAIKFFDKKNLVLFQCTSEYPCSAENVGLNVLEKFKKYKCTLGLSDHTLGIAAAISAIARGAKVIEKHVTFSKKMYGSDARHSMEPHEFKIFCKEIKDAFIMNNTIFNKNDLRQFNKMRFIFQKSIYIKKDLKLGTKLAFDHLSFKKPGGGIPSTNYKKIIGKKIKKNMKKNYKLKLTDLN